MKARNRIRWGAPAVLLLAGTTGVYSAELLTPHVEQAPDLLLQPETKPGLFRLGMFDFIPQLSVGMTYDNNILAASTNLISDFIWNIAPGITAVASDPVEGKIFSLNYTPSFVFYTENTSENNIGQSVSLKAVLPLSRLTLGLDGSMTIQQSALVGSGQLVESRSYVGNPTAKYQLGAKTALEVDGKVNLQQGEGVIGNNTWGNNDWLDYRFSDMLSAAIGVSFNYTTIENAPDQTYEQVLIRAVYTVTEKIVLKAAAGPEWRQYGDQRSATLTPAVVVGASYRIGDRTTVNLDVLGHIQTSLDVQGQNYYDTALRLSVTQQLADRITLSVVGGFEHDRYYSVSPGVTADEPTDLFTAGGGLNYQIRERWTAGIFYYYRRNTGNATFNEFTDNQVGIQTSWRY